MVYYYTKNKRFTENSFYKPIENIQEVVKELEKEAVLALDTETNGLNPFENKVIMLQIGTKTDQYVFDVRGLDTEKYFKTLLEKEDIQFIGHNIKFDYNMLKRYNIVLQNVYDTMLADMVIYNDEYSSKYVITNRRFSLGGVYYHYFNKAIEKETRLEFTNWGSTPFTDAQIKYGALDVVYPFEIKEKQDKLTAELNTEVCNRLEFKTLLSVGDMEYNGFHLDPSKWMEAYLFHKNELEASYLRLDKALIKDFPTYEQKAYQLSLFEEVERRRLTDINWNSSLQVKTLLNKEYKIFPEDKDGKDSVGGPALKLLFEKPDIILELIVFKEHEKAVSSFGEKFLKKHLHKDSRLRSNFNQIVGTGRMSSRNPNLQQIPNSKEYRSAFTAPKGKVIITADYSNQEGRVMADMSNDRSYIDFFNGDVSVTFGDAHSFIAEKMFSASAGEHVEVPPKPPEENTPEEIKALEYFNTHPNKKLRQMGKILNFMISFGGSAFTLSKTLKIPEEEAQGLIDAFYKGFPSLKIMFTKFKNEALRTGLIRMNTVVNRIRRLPEWKRYKELSSKDFYNLTKEEKSELGKIKGRIERKSMNSPVQGSAGDMTKTALVLIRKKLLAEGIRPLLNAPIKLVQCVHDEIVLEADENHKELAASILQSSMETAGTFYTSQVRMTASPVIKLMWDH